MNPYFRWWLRGRKAFIIAGLAIVTTLGILIILDGYYLNWQMTGFGSKTLWEWLELLIVPIILAFGAYLFNSSEKKETALQGYLDQMSELLLDKDSKLYDPSENNRARAVAQARTSSILKRLDGNRKAVVLLFLYETKLINKDNTIINLDLADLRGAVLHNASLQDANLEGANLYYANLRNANLCCAKLTSAQLIGAYLYNADLRDTDLSGTANLTRANLNAAQLSGANLENAILDGAQVHDANFTGSTNLTLTSLKGVDLRKAKLEGVDLSSANRTGAKFTKKQKEQLTVAASRYGCQLTNRSRDW